MNKKIIPISILILIVVLIIAILVQNLAAPSSIPATNTPVASNSFISSATAPVQYQPATSTGSVDPADDQTLAVITLKAPNRTLKIEVASTSVQQARGLGGRISIPPEQGMIFPFTYPGDYGFWMKDMHFPLDMVWISSNKKVVSVTPDISPDTYPTVFYPPLTISYVLELNAGTAREFGIATGTQLAF